MKDKTQLKKYIEDFNNQDINTSIDDFKLILNELMKTYRCLTRVVDSYYCYRARINYNNKRFYETSNLYYPPENLVSSMGRMNRTKSSLFYISASYSTAILEVRPSINDVITVMRYKLKDLTRKPHVMELGVAETNSQYSLKGNVNIIENTSNNFFFQNDEDIEYNILIRNFLAKEVMKIINKGNENDYRKSIAIYEILTESDKIDGLLYPSIAGDGTRKGGGTNMVLKTSSADKLFIPDYAWESKVINIYDVHGYEMKCTNNSKRITNDQIIWELNN